MNFKIVNVVEPIGYTDTNFVDNVGTIFTLTAVGGIAELPVLSEDGPQPESLANGPATGRDYALLAAVLAVGAVMLAAGTWCARRRWFV